jgi:ADP-heptose:LPS heptosyltransferase
VYLIRFSQSVEISFSKSAGTVALLAEPGRDYVISTAQYSWLRAAPCATAIDRVSTLDSRLRGFVAALVGARGRLLFYAGAGGYGDQLMAMPVVRFLHELGYTVTVMTDPGNQTCWWHLPFVQETVVLPLPYTQLRMYDHHALFEFVTNLDEHPDQTHPVDAMLWRLGLDPRTVPDDRKRVAPTLHADELAAARQFIAGNRVALYQLAGSGDNRRLNPAASRQLLMRLAELVPELSWVAIYDRHLPAEYYAPLPSDAPANTRLVEFPSLRQLFAVASLADVGVGTDSLLVHLMGAYGRPGVGLWGALKPELRMRYYQGHRAVFLKASCPQAPCLRYKASLERCPPAARTARMCLCLQDVEPEHVAGVVREAITEQCLQSQDSNQPSHAT